MRADDHDQPAATDGAGYRQTLQVLQRVLARILMEAGEPDPGPIPPERRITDVAANSVQLLQVHAGLEEELGIEIAAAAFFEHDSLADLARHLCPTG
ncbi:acyl carrier protein [Solwaraspora sp. WMMD791]|uniref:acyl carrier protein n=1 Tax=Solwaraspora sp. WMMD791 TaxID=3016086 RepID=UPI00249A590C|nr:acyl carrier protein [Solwaraspora sp. WMMD791]WFE29200.1 acyl carrier protein [Solwaraspora sp. WMMD791]